MGKLNNVLNDFLKDNQEFEDIVNLSVYGGEKVIRASDLEDVEPEKCWPFCRAARR